MGSTPPMWLSVALDAAGPRPRARLPFVQVDGAGNEAGRVAGRRRRQPDLPGEDLRGPLVEDQRVDGVEARVARARTDPRAGASRFVAGGAEIFDPLHQRLSLEQG